MANIFEKFLGKKKEEPAAIKEPTFEELCGFLPEESKKELCDLAKEISGESGSPTNYFEGNYDDLSPEQKRFNELIGLARKEYFGVGEEGHGQQ